MEYAPSGTADTVQIILINVYQQSDKVSFEKKAMCSGKMSLEKARGGIRAVADRRDSSLIGVDVWLNIDHETHSIRGDRPCVSFSRQDFHNCGRS